MKFYQRYNYTCLFISWAQSDDFLLLVVYVWLIWHIIWKSLCNHDLFIVCNHHHHCCVLSTVLLDTLLIMEISYHTPICACMQYRSLGKLILLGYRLWIWQPYFFSWYIWLSSLPFSFAAFILFTYVPMSQ